MPTYAYVCTACDHSFEAVQAITDDALTECPSCGGVLRKKFHPVGVTFKGSGFYRTDSRSSSSSGVSGGGSKESGGAAKESGDGGWVRARRGPEAAGPPRRRRTGVLGRLAPGADRPRGLDPPGRVQALVRALVQALVQAHRSRAADVTRIACGQAGVTASSVVPSGHDRPFPAHRCDF